MKWLRKLFGMDSKTQVSYQPEPDPPIQIDPDPDMAPGEWEWHCTEPGCEAGGTGPDQLMRHDCMMHSLYSGHGTIGNAL